MTSNEVAPSVEKKDLGSLRDLSTDVRLDILETIHKVGAGHSGPSLSIVEILVVLYFLEMRVDPQNPAWDERDRFVLSKGHGALALYSVLARKGFYPRAELFTYESLGSRLQGHPDCQLTPGVEMSTGSLGQGLSVSIGYALGARKLGYDCRVYCVIGDGESQEGNIWEAAMAASKFKLGNLCAIVDWNELQGGVTSDVMPSLEPFGAKWEAFGWHVLDIDGHDVEELVNAFEQARQVDSQPTLIIARTVKGKGVSFMEGNVDWHSGKLGTDDYETARTDVLTAAGRRAK